MGQFVCGTWRQTNWTVITKLGGFAGRDEANSLQFFLKFLLNLILFLVFVKFYWGFSFFSSLLDCPFAINSTQFWTWDSSPQIKGYSLTFDHNYMHHKSALFLKIYQFSKVFNNNLFYTCTCTFVNPIWLHAFR